MKVKIEIEEGLAEEEVVIRCPSLSDSVIALQNYISKQGNGKRCLSLKNGETEFFTATITNQVRSWCNFT